MPKLTFDEIQAIIEIPIIRSFIQFKKALMTFGFEGNVGENGYICIFEKYE